MGQINDSLLRTLEAEREGKSIAVEDGDGTKEAAPLLDLEGGKDDPVVGKVRSNAALKSQEISLMIRHV